MQSVESLLVERNTHILELISLDKGSIDNSFEANLARVIYSTETLSDIQNKLTAMKAEIAGIWRSNTNKQGVITLT